MQLHIQSLLALWSQGVHTLQGVVPGGCVANALRGEHLAAMQGSHGCEARVDCTHARGTCVEQ